MVLGPRLGRYSRQGETRDIPGQNLSLVTLGGFILWLGWFGFNGGSITSIDKDNLGLVLLNTHLGGCAGRTGVLFFKAIKKQPILLSATVNGSIAGLVSITAGAAHFSPISAIIVRFAGGCFYLLGINLLDRLQLDDVVGLSVDGLVGYGAPWL